MYKLFLSFIILVSTIQCHASEGMAYSFSIVPQQASSKLARQWVPVLQEVSRLSGVELKFVTNKDIPTFESKLAQGKHDFSYMNPYHYVVYHNMQGYNALNKAKDKQIKGIIVVHKDSPISTLEELADQDITFPSPAAFAASILPRANLSKRGINITPKYVSSHDSVYRNIANKHFVAGGGIIRTFKSTNSNTKKDLKILWTSPGYTPHAIASHSRVPEEVAKKVQAAFAALEASEEGRAMLDKLKIKGWVKAQNSDWDDVRSLNIDLIK